MNKYKLVLAGVCFGYTASFAQPTKRDVELYGLTAHMNIEDVRKGQNLEQVKVFTLKQFVDEYVRPRHHIYGKMDGPVTFEQLYKDTAYTYFTRRRADAAGYVRGIFKVANSVLATIDLAALNTDEINRRYIEEIIPAKHKKWAAAHNTQRISDFHSYSYKYIEATNELEVRCHWVYYYKAVMDERKTRRYCARYNVGTRQFVR